MVDDKEYLAKKGFTHIEHGLVGEQMARDYLQASGYKVFEIDWIAEKDGVMYQIETKRKEPFKPPPYFGHGLEVWKARQRLDFERKTGIIAYLLVFEMDGSIYGQKFSVLEAGRHFDTKNGIRIYDIGSFDRLD
jgi:hypothetical protein